MPPCACRYQHELFVNVLLKQAADALNMRLNGGMRRAPVPLGFAINVM